MEDTHFRGKGERGKEKSGEGQTNLEASKNSNKSTQLTQHEPSLVNQPNRNVVRRFQNHSRVHRSVSLQSSNMADSEPTSPVAAEAPADEAAKPAAAAEETSTEAGEATAAGEPSVTAAAVTETAADEPSTDETSKEEAAATTTKEPRKKSVAGIPIYCSCRKSQCIKLYCSCFDAGIDCVADCSCKKCKNNPKARMEAQKAEHAAKKERERKMDLIAAAKEEATMLLI
eukprot:scaffold9257_cov81-Skeletonema_dohrnii-CCMP3373.AAC.3